MQTLPNCPNCDSGYTYEDRDLYVCPECAHEWDKNQDASAADEGSDFIDSNGNQLQDGDSVVVIKDLKVKGTSSVIKVGTKVKNVRLNQNDLHLDCKITGIGVVKLLTKVVKKT